MTKLSEKPLEVDSKPKSTTPQVRTIIKKVDVSPEIKTIFYRLDGEANKVWGTDNSYFDKNNKPKYKNIWDYWNIFKEWFEREVLNQ